VFSWEGAVNVKRAVLNPKNGRTRTMMPRRISFSFFRNHFQNPLLVMSISYDPTGPIEK
jgi:hypothetical protein